MLTRQVAICRGKDARESVATLRVGEWSEWICAAFEMAAQGSAEGAFGFKLLKLARDGSRVRLLYTDAESTGPDRTLQPTHRPVVQRPTIKPRPVGLQGDLIDEE